MVGRERGGAVLWVGRWIRVVRCGRMNSLRQCEVCGRFPITKEG